MIVLATEWALNFLANNPEFIACDGTFQVHICYKILSLFIIFHNFYSSPRGFKLLYQLFAIVDHAAIPLIHGLLPGKHQIHYTHFFEAVMQQMPDNWQPVHIMSDFEASSINAMNELFPRSLKHGCFFHFGQAHFRKVQSLSDIRAAYNDQNIQIQTKCLQALSFVPEQYIYSYFVICIGHLDRMVHSNQIQGFKSIKLWHSNVILYFSISMVHDPYVHWSRILF